MSPRRFDAVVVGAGPAGSTTAILLARAGWSVALVEKALFPRRKVCGECIAASNLGLLDALGIGPQVAAQAGPELRQVALMQGARIVMADLPAADAPGPPWGFALGRETLDTLLLARARAEGVHVMQPFALLDISGPPGDHVCVVREVGGAHAATGRTAGTQKLHAAAVVAAHGSWEPLPSERALARTRPRASDLLAFKANFTGAALTDGVLPVLSARGAYGGMVVADGAITTLACCVRRDQIEASRRLTPQFNAGTAVEAFWKRECCGVSAALDGAQRVGPWLASGPLRPGLRLQGEGGIFRVGNAAAEAHPIIGEGMSMAMQSAWLLCGHLLETPERPARPGPAAVLWHQRVQERYAAHWRREFRQRLRLAACFAHLAMRPALMRPAFALLQKWPGILTQGAVWGGKTRSAVSSDQIESAVANCRTAVVSGQPEASASFGASGIPQAQHHRKA
ncbi:MAG: FAD-dependent oxidoreductase [Pseudomonadota bacterium]